MEHNTETESRLVFSSSLNVMTVLQYIVISMSCAVPLELLIRKIFEVKESDSILAALIVAITFIPVFIMKTRMVYIYTDKIVLTKYSSIEKISVLPNEINYVIIVHNAKYGSSISFNLNNGKRYNVGIDYSHVGGIEDVVAAFKTMGIRIESTEFPY